MTEFDEDERLYDPYAEERDEIAEKAVYWDSYTVNARLDDAFLGPARAEAAVALAGLAPAPDCPIEADIAACRLMLDAIKVSEGDVFKLQLWVEAARNDPRDLIAAAEYPLELVEGESARDRDLDDYLAWAAGDA